mmetsp:Transcript_39054/g.90418  ORF Transcript_39054/g.90418 Transcript_39054/m.90418 type:complete len:295 (-) Transcript_39054:212-1096(-)
MCVHHAVFRERARAFEVENVCAAVGKPRPAIGRHHTATRGSVHGFAEVGLWLPTTGAFAAVCLVARDDMVAWLKFQHSFTYILHYGGRLHSEDTRVRLLLLSHHISPRRHCGHLANTDLPELGWRHLHLDQLKQRLVRQGNCSQRVNLLWMTVQDLHRRKVARWHLRRKLSKNFCHCPTLLSQFRLLLRLLLQRLGILRSHALFFGLLSCWIHGVDRRRQKHARVRAPPQHSPQERGMELEVIVDETGNEIIGMVVIRLHPKRERNALLITNCLQQSRLELLRQEHVFGALVHQ